MDKLNETWRPTFDVMKQVADALHTMGEEWEVAIDKQGAPYLTQSEERGGEIRFSDRWKKGAYHITGYFPGIQTYRLHVEYPSINVSMAKTPERIAKDLFRRLLPEYLEMLAQHESDLSKHKEYAARHEAFYQKVLEAVGETPSDYERANRRISFYVSGDLYGEVKTYGESAEFDLRHVPAELALKLIALLKEYCTERREALKDE